jgi:UPF0176 protein
MDKPYKVILYYKFHPIENPEQFTNDHRGFCQKHNLVGRILIAKEGINGTCAGLPEDIEAYKQYVHAQQGFEDMWFKEHAVDKLPLKKLKVQLKPEIVALRKDVDMSKTAAYLSPKEFHEMVEKSFDDDSIVVLDGRNEIEARIGRFKNAVVPKIRFFRELKEEIKKEDYDKLKGKKVLMYCTGGIRCEKASALLKEEGFREVYQLHGGIYNYLQHYPNGYFEGTCFVFDDRMQITIDGDEAEDGNKAPENKIISKCEFCNKKSNRIVNDEREAIRYLRVCCAECDQKMDMSRVRYDSERKDSMFKA